MHFSQIFSKKMHGKIFRFYFFTGFGIEKVPPGLAFTVYPPPKETRFGTQNLKVARFLIFPVLGTLNFRLKPL